MIAPVGKEPPAIAEERKSHEGSLCTLACQSLLLDTTSLCRSHWYYMRKFGLDPFENLFGWSPRVEKSCGTSRDPIFFECSRIFEIRDTTTHAMLGIFYLDRIAFLIWRIMLNELLEFSNFTRTLKKDDIRS